MIRGSSQWRNALQLSIGLASLVVLAAGCSLPFAASTAAPTSTAAKGHHARLVALAHGKTPQKRAVYHVRYSPPAAPFPDRRAFARRILPILNQSVPVFDRAVAAVSSAGGVSNMAGPCTDYSSQVQIQMAYVDGVPHQFPWYTAAGSFHHQVIGVYNDMAGALVACQTAVESQDDGTASTALADMGQAAAQLRQTLSYTRWLAQH